MVEIRPAASSLGAIWARLGTTRASVALRLVTGRLALHGPSARSHRRWRGRAHRSGGRRDRTATATPRSRGHNARRGRPSRTGPATPGGTGNASVPAGSRGGEARWDRSCSSGDEQRSSSRCAALRAICLRKGEAWQDRTCSSRRNGHRMAHLSLHCASACPTSSSRLWARASRRARRRRPW